MPTPKPPGHSCPHCGGVCAEYQQQGQPMRWTCNLCGRGGLIEVEAQVVQETVKPVKRHWSELGDKGLRVHAPSLIRWPEKQVATGGNANCQQT